MPKSGGAGLFKEGVGAVEDVASFGVKEVKGTVSKFTSTIIQNKGIAVGLMVGMATLAVIKGIVDDLFMPLLSPVLGDAGTGEWSSKELHLGPVRIRIGSLMATLFNYFLTIIAIYVFIHALE